MRKMKFNPVFAIVTMLLVSLMVGCKKDKTTSFTGGTKEIRLLLPSAAGTIDVGAVVFRELADGGVSSTINLTSGFRFPGTNLNARVTTFDAIGTVLTYVDLGTVDGGSGVGVKSPVVNAGVNVPYAELIAKKGFIVRVNYSATIEATGVIN